jgi:hypothetical protein
MKLRKNLLRNILLRIKNKKKIEKNNNIKND